MTACSFLTLNHFSFSLRPYIVNLLPCLARICRREEEAIQETLSQAMQKLCPPLMGFANESEVKVGSEIRLVYSMNLTSDLVILEISF